MKKTIFTIFTLLLMISTSKSVFAQTNDQPIVSFEQVEQLPKDTAVKIPVLINTQGKSLDSLQLRINIEGEVENLGLQIGTSIPVQEIAQEINDKSLFVSLTSIDLGKSWSTKEDTELLAISFTHTGSGMVTLSFDEKETLAATIDSENNVLSIGEALTVKIGEVVPQEEVATEITPSVTQQELPTQQEESNLNQINNNLLIGLIAASFVAAAITLVYILKGGAKNKVNQEPKSPLN